MSAAESPQGQILRLAGQLNLPVGSITDGYHTIDELYEHRIVLYIQLCKRLQRAFIKSQGMFADGESRPVWCSTKHSDGSEWQDWFILGIYTVPGKQITYHLPARYWSEVCEFATVLEKAPEFDGHTSADVLERLKSL